MEIKIRENIEEHMSSLKEWVAQIADDNPEEMDGFFTARVEGYEEHMSVWKAAYRRFAQLLPEECVNILDLGCGTGLELDEIWKRNPAIAVTGVDLCQSMLDKLLEKHDDKTLETVCMDYFKYDFGTDKWDAVISFESLHHFIQDKKKGLYEKIHRSLKENAVFILGDYIACCDEEEELLQDVLKKKRRKFGIPEDKFVHFDIPLTLEHETEALRAAGFSQVEALDSIEGATLLMARK